MFQKFPQQLEQTGLLHISVLHKFNYDDNFIIIIFVIIIFIIITYPVRLLNDVKSWFAYVSRNLYISVDGWLICQKKKSKTYNTFV